MALTVAFVRHRQRRDRIYVTRHDGTSTFWDFPSYGDRLPHDLIHLVVEDSLGIVNGFWGIVAAGVEVTLIDDQATLVADGRPLVEKPGIDFSDLMRAEEAVALLSPSLTTEHTGGLAVARLDPMSADESSPSRLGTDLGFKLPSHRSTQPVDSIRKRLDELGQQWRGLDDGTAITLTFVGRGHGHRHPQT
jgi:hypothetical protein